MWKIQVAGVGSTSPTEIDARRTGTHGRNWFWEQGAIGFFRKSTTAATATVFLYTFIKKKAVQ
jgi:hypothetical protein